MIHITVQLTTRASPVRNRSSRSLVAQDEMEDMLIEKISGNTSV
jgi:hypothetical protein